MNPEDVETCESCGKRGYKPTVGWMFFVDGPALCPDCCKEGTQNDGKDQQHYYDREASKKAHHPKKLKPVATTAQMRTLIENLKPGNVTDSQQALLGLLDQLIKEMQSR